MTGKQKVLGVLKDKQWHSFLELEKVYYKFTQRLFDLRKDGYSIEERTNQSNKHALDYRLSYSPVKNPIEPSSLSASHTSTQGDFLINQEEIVQGISYFK